MPPRPQYPHVVLAVLLLICAALAAGATIFATFPSSPVGNANAATTTIVPASTTIVPASTSTTVALSTTTVPASTTTVPASTSTTNQPATTVGATTTTTSSIIEPTGNNTPGTPPATGASPTVTTAAAHNTIPRFISRAPSREATAGTPYTHMFVAAGTPAPRYALVHAPAWLTIGPATGITGGRIPLRASRFTYSVRASNTAGSDVAGPYTVTVGRPYDQIVILFTGGLRYGLAGTTTSGLISISPYGRGTLSTISGTATVPSTHGRQATVTFEFARLSGSLLIGTLQISDPKSKVDISTPVAAVAVTRDGPSAATGTLIPATSPGYSLGYTYKFTVLEI